MRIERWLVVACLFLLACPQRLAEEAPEAPPAPQREEVPPVLPVLVRVHNATDVPWADVFLDEGSLRTFGGLERGATSAPMPFEWVTKAPRLGFLSGATWVETSRAKGTSRLPPGRYLLEVGLEGDAPTVTVRPEGALPSGEELGEAFAEAEAALTPSLARAFVHLKRRDTLRCGSSLDVGGSARMRWFVAPSGRPGGVALISDIYKGTPVEECLVAAVKRWRFPRYTGDMPPAGEYEVQLSQ